VAIHAEPAPVADGDARMSAPHSPENPYPKGTLIAAQWEIEKALTVFAHAAMAEFERVAAPVLDCISRVLRGKK
jgi:hypothetical protein